MSIYHLLRAPLFGLPPETAHEVVTGTMDRVLGTAAARSLVRRALSADDPALRVRLWEVDFPGPVGLAAGFDKSGSHFNALAALGFGFIEIGTVTAKAQPGNPRPRLFRLPADQALVNRMGFNNPGADAVSRRLQGAPIETVLGVNLGKSKVTPLEEATGDYLYSVDRLQPFARYLVVNVSSPNTPGLRSLQEAGPLRELLRAVVGRVRENAGAAAPPPVLVKLAPDLTDPQVDQAVEIALEEGCSGIVAVNTTVSRTGLRTSAGMLERIGAGGLSGPPLRARAHEVVRRIFSLTRGAVPIVGVGGIRSAEDAWERIRAGASLVQLYTGLVYEGPDLVRRINRGLAERMRREGVGSLAEVVGSAHR